MDLAALLMLGGAGFVAPKSPALATAVVVVGTLGFLAIGKSQRLALVLIGLLTKIPPVARYREKLLTAHASLFELWGTAPFFAALGLSIAA